MINLLPWRDERARLCKRKQLMLIVLVTLVTFSCLFSWRFFLINKIERMTKENRHLVLSIWQENKKGEKLLCDSARFHKYYMRAKLAEQQSRLVKLLLFISEIFPPSCYLNSCLLNDKGIVLEGVASEINKNAINLFIKRLKRKNINAKEIEHKNMEEFAIAIVF